jgi:hypothetical protein
MWKRIWMLFVARNKEFYRDRSALGWNLLFPFLIIIGYSFLFGGNAQSLYKVGVVRDTGNDGAALPAQFVEFRKTRYVEFVEFDTVEQGLARLTHHRIDLLVQPSAKRYWMSSTSRRVTSANACLHQRTRPRPAASNARASREARTITSSGSFRASSA